MFIFIVVLHVEIWVHRIFLISVVIVRIGRPIFSYVGYALFFENNKGWFCGTLKKISEMHRVMNLCLCVYRFVKTEVIVSFF